MSMTPGQQIEKWIREQAAKMASLSLMLTTHGSQSA